MMPGKIAEVVDDPTSRDEVIINLEPDRPSWHGFTLEEAEKLAWQILRRVAQRRGMEVSGVEHILLERYRQLAEEGWSATGDDAYKDGQMPRAAACYAMIDVPTGPFAWPAALWPWMRSWWKPKSPIRNLSRAGALIAAEIDRRLRAGEKP